MNSQGPLSPSSVASSEWSPSRYQTSSPRQYNAPTGRAHLATPPISGSSSNGMSGPFMPGMNGPGGPRPPGGPGGEFRGNPSPPNSVGRSSNGTQLSVEAQRRKQSMMEDSLGQHYVALKRYLAATLAAEANDGRPNRARDKLVRLSPTQFQELSTDVYDELLRRQAQQAGTLPPNAPPFLPPRDTFHPKRNQARQKLSTLPAPRFRALATDVFFELERRFPRFAAGNIGRIGSPGMGPPSRTGTPNGMRPDMRRPPPRQGSLGGSLGGQVLAGGMPGMTDGPMQKSSQSNTIVPNKSYLVEDDDDGDLDSVYGGRRDTTQTSRSFNANEKIISDYQNKVEELQEKIGTLEKQVQEKEEALTKATNDHVGSTRDLDNQSAEWSRTRQSLEDQVSHAQNLNDNLQAEIDRMKSLHDEKEQDFQTQLNMLAQKGSDGGEWRSRYENIQREKDDLQRMNDELQQDLQGEHGVAEEVRREAASILLEMKAISDQHDASYEREERLNQQLMRMEDELKEWKSRYARLKTQAGDARAAGTAIQQPDFDNNKGLISASGLISDVSLTQYQLAIDDTLRNARGKDPRVLDSAMQSAILALKTIMTEASATTSAPAQKQLVKINATAKTFITAVKNQAASPRALPVSLVDAAASHLSNAVAELVHSVKLRPTSGSGLNNGVVDDLDVDDEDSTDDITASYAPEPLKSDKYFSTNGRSSFSESVYSTNTAVANGRASTKLSMLPSTSYRAPSYGSMPNGGRSTSYLSDNQNGVDERDEDKERLIAIQNMRRNLEEKSAQLVDPTNTLLNSIRNGVSGPEALTLTMPIIQTVRNAAAIAEQGLVEQNLKSNSSEGYLQDLRSRAALLAAETDEGRRVWSGDDWTSIVPKKVFEIRSRAKELVTLFPEQGILSRTMDDDFS